MTGHPPLLLGDLVHRLRARLDALNDGELRQILVRHAERLPAAAREDFLAIFPAPDAPSASAADTSGGQALTARVAEFVDRVASGAFNEMDELEDEWAGHGRYGWQDEEPTPSWVPEAEALFTDAGELFLAGRLDEARQAYTSLMDLFTDTGDRPWCLEIWHLDQVDVTETLARYLRTVYETSSPDQRAAEMLQAWSVLPWSPRPLTLGQVAGTLPTPLPALGLFLPGWTDLLVSAPPHGNDRRGPLGLRNRIRLLTEAAQLGDGPDALAGLARRPGPHQGPITLAWVDALRADGHARQAADAAAYGLSLPAIEPPVKAQLGDRLAALAGHLQDRATAVEARRTAWQSHRTRARLLALAADSQAAGVREQALAEQADHVPQAGRQHEQDRPDRWDCELLILAGRLDQVAAALEHSAALGWSRHDHPGPVVLPCLWVTAIGATPASGQLLEMFAAIDSLPDTPPHHTLFLDEDPDPHRDVDHHVPLTQLISAQLQPPPAARQRKLLARARAVVDARINAIVSNKHRGAYARAAALAFAHAETHAACGQQSEADDYLADVWARFPRHVAFRDELTRAAGGSPLRLPGPAVRRPPARR